MKFYTLSLLILLSALFIGCEIVEAPQPQETETTAQETETTPQTTVPITDAPPAGSVGIAYAPNYYNNTCTILGIGAACDPELVIPEEIDGFIVTAIERDAFRDCKFLTSVTLPDTICRIGSGAFSGCASLKSINLPRDLKLIGVQAFSGCSSLTSAVFAVPEDWMVFGTAPEGELSDPGDAALALRLQSDGEWSRYSSDPALTEQAS